MTNAEMNLARFHHRCRIYLESVEPDQTKLFGVAIDDMPEESLRDALKVMAHMLAEERDTASFFATGGRAA